MEKGTPIHFKANIYLSRKPNEACPSKWEDDVDTTPASSAKMMGKAHEVLQGLVGLLALAIVTSIGCHRPARPTLALLNAAEKGDAAQVAAHLYWKTDPNTKDSDGLTALHVAVLYKQCDVAKLLVEGGADLNPTSKDGLTPLGLAAMAGQESIGELLLAHGALVGITDKHQLTILHLAAWGRADKLVRLLVARGADPNAPDKDGATPLHYARSKATAEALVAAGASVDARTTSAEGAPPLGGMGPQREEWEDLTPAEKLAEQYAESYDVRAVGRTPLQSAALRGQLDIMGFLVANGADVNAKASKGACLLHFAANGQVAGWIIARGANVNTRDSYGRTPLHYAMDRDASLAETLIANGAVVNARDNGGETPLDLGPSPEVELVLRRHGARE